MTEEKTPSEISDKLRSAILCLTPEDIGLNKDIFPHPVFGLVMETGFHEGSFTLSALADGNTSLSFSNGGGITGTGEQEGVREASGYLLTEAQRIYDKAEKVISFSKPDTGKVTFYFMTFDGVLSYSTKEDVLENKKDEFSYLFFAAHNVIMALRKIDENA